ncbi:MAG: hypothetical protein CBD21_04565 [bacterium TMED161]|nr:MAG: hypothetical protein CBD21_04565 [bacterium TMED161]
MQLLLRFLFLFTIGFMYADCEQYTNEVDCGMHSECEWHADEMACEDAGSDDHDDHEAAGNVIEVTGLSEGATTFTLSIMHDGHADYTSMPIYIDVHGDEEGDDGHDGEHSDDGPPECFLDCPNIQTLADWNSGIINLTTDEVCTIYTSWENDTCTSDCDADNTAFINEVISTCTECLSAGNCDEMVDEEEHCEDFLTEADCGMHSECEWHADEMACEDAGSDDHDGHEHGDCGDFDHLNIDGISLEHDGMVVYSQFQGYITGSLELHVNQSMDLTVHFLDTNGNEIEYTEENPAACFPLGFEISDPSIVSITIEENHDDHDDDDHDDHDHEEDCVNGDANMDGSVNVSDIVLLVGFIVGNNPLDSDHDCAEYIQDGNIDILDIVALVAVILGERGEEATSAEFTQRDNVFAMNANGIVGAVQITLSHGNNFEIELTGNALVAEYHTDKNRTTLIVVNPVNDIFTTNNDYVIEEIIAATTEGYIATSWAKPGAIELSNAYPNPFNPSTSFDLNVSSPGFVSLNVYNLNGQLVDVIFEGNMDAGIYNMTWNGAELSSGMYILQAVSAEKVSTQKLTLLK